MRATIVDMPDEPKPEQDVVLLGGPTEDGKGVRVLRAKDDTLSTGEVRPLEEGKPLGEGEIVKLRAHKDAPRVCDVQVVHKIEAPPRAQRRTGPPQVASEAYRQRWDEVFKKTDEDDLAN